MEIVAFLLALQHAKHGHCESSRNDTEKRVELGEEVLVEAILAACVPHASVEQRVDIHVDMIGFLLLGLCECLWISLR